MRESSAAATPRWHTTACTSIWCEELIANDILVVQTGCSAIACAKVGLLTPEAAEREAGKGLAEVCAPSAFRRFSTRAPALTTAEYWWRFRRWCARAVWAPISRDLPAAGAAPEWMSEKAIAIGQYFVASGVFTVFGVGLPVTGSSALSAYLFKEMEEVFGGMWAVEPDPAKMATLMIDHINAKRRKLGIDRGRERVLYDMEMRRDSRCKGPGRCRRS